jgi:hypothetical protein
MASESVAIVVVPRDRFSTFPSCLDALYAHTGMPFRLVVVAGATDRDTRDYLMTVQGTHQNVDLILPDHLLPQSESRNLGLRHTKDRYCVVLENDTIVHANWLAPMLRCLQDEGAAVVTPLMYWYRGVHTAGCMFDERLENGTIVFRHRILYGDIHRKRIDYPENHCVLIDRQVIPDDDLFEEVEPFDVDLGLLLRKRRLSAYVEPQSVATYASPPPIEVRDVSPYKLRWDPVAWKVRNRRFMKKWNVTYDPSHKIASYRRQQLKLGLANWIPTPFTVGLSNVGFRWSNHMLARIAAWEHPIR